LADLNTGDGLLSSIKLLDIYAHERDVFDKVQEFHVYPQLLENVRFQTKAELEKASSDPALKELVAKEEASLKGNGRILVRASGTEPLLRVMAEALDGKECDRVVKEIVSYIKRSN